MGQLLNKFKKAGEEGKAKEQAPKDAKSPAEILKEQYDPTFKNITTFEDFYLQFYLVIEKVNEQGGAMQVKLPKKDDLEKTFKKHCPTGKLTKEQFQKIMGELNLFEGVSFGQGALDGIMFLFGIPIIAMLAKRAIPATKSISDDLVIPAATAGTAVILIKTRKL